MEIKWGGKNFEVRENFIDRTVKFFSPIRGQARFKARVMEAVAGQWFGASKTRRSVSQWTPKMGDADADTVFDLPTLRDRSRDLARNSPIAVGAISTTLTNVVGTGLKLQSRIDREILSFTEEQADAWEAKTEREFRLWADSRECDSTRKLNFASMQELAFRQVLEAGEAFTLLPKFQRQGSPYLLKLQMVEGDRVCNADNLPNSKNLIEGIRKDDQGAATEYHILKQHPGAPYYSQEGRQWDRVPAFGSKTGLPNVIHLFRVLRPGQTRGVPYLSPVIETIKQIGTYTDAEIMAAVISAFFTVFIKTESGKLDMDLTGMGAETGAKASDTDMKLASGAILGLAKGEEIQVANPSRPNAVFGAFMTSILEQIGTALEIPYEIIIRHFSASFSASRAALLEAWRFFSGRRTWLATNFCQTVFESFLYEAVASGRIIAPGFFAEEMLRKAYSGSEWIGDAPGYIDPAKDVDAAKARIDARLSTVDRETTLLTGGDYEKNLPRIRKEQKELAEIAKIAQSINPPAKPAQGGTGNENP